jgi:uncharacterized protein
VFELLLQDDQRNVRTLVYDPLTSECHWQDTGEPLNLETVGMKPPAVPPNWRKAIVVSPSQHGKKHRKAKNIKIQMGLKCNYACSYCNQAAQPHDFDGNPKKVDWFLSKMPEWFDIGDGSHTTIEFWGGEPFVYWKTLKPLAEGVRKLYPKADFNIISNGSLLDQEKVDWLVELGFGLGISHDGPAYEVQRGEDPLKNPEQLKWIKYAYEQLSPKGNIGFNCVLSNKNVSLHIAREYIGHYLGIDPRYVPMTTEEILLPYDEGGMSLSVLDDHTSKRLTHTVFYEAIRGFTMNINSVETKLKTFLQSIAMKRPADALGQKCGMDREDNIAVDMNGNVMTCQNMSALTDHNMGHLNAFDHIRLKKAYHWSTREECVKCPVLQMCRGACLFLENEMWSKACDNSFAYNVGALAAALFHATHMVLIEIRGDAIRRDGVTSVPVIDKEFLFGPLPQWFFDGNVELKF